MIDIHQNNSSNVSLVRALLRVFGEVFEDDLTYIAQQPSDSYLEQLLSSYSFIALVALRGGDVVGGLTAYILQKFEQDRREIYIYDLAVRVEYRRQGIATALIHKLREIAAERGVYMVFVQADTGVEDQPAIALYEKLGQRTAIWHFNIAVGN